MTEYNDNNAFIWKQQTFSRKRYVINIEQSHHARSARSSPSNTGTPHVRRSNASKPIAPKSWTMAPERSVARLLPLKQGPLRNGHTEPSCAPKWRSVKTLIIVSFTLYRNCAVTRARDGRKSTAQILWSGGRLLKGPTKQTESEKTGKTRTPAGASETTGVMTRRRGRSPPFAFQDLVF